MIAFVRDISPRVDCCEAAVANRAMIDPKLARKQHAAFVAALQAVGVQVENLGVLSEQPDGVFVEDCAILLPEAVILARPGLATRQAEIDSIVATVGQHRPAQSIVDPATLDGRDVLRIGRTIYVAESRCTNADGVAQLRDIVAAHGYDVHVVSLRDGRHLKSACTFIPPHFLLANPAWIDPAQFGNLILIPVDEKEPSAANTVTAGRTTFVSASHHKTEKRLRDAGIVTKRVEMSEFEKVETGPSSLCLILEPRTANHTAAEMELKPVHAKGVPATDGHCSQAVVHGGLVFTSPLLPFEPGTTRGRRPSVEEQAEQVFRNLALVLTASRSCLGRVVRTTVHLADPKHTPRVDAICAQMFGNHRPARAVVANGALPPGVLVAIEAVAALGEEMS